MDFFQRYSNVQPRLITDVKLDNKFHRLHFVPHQRSLQNSETPQRIYEGYVTLNEFTAVIVRARMIFFLNILIVDSSLLSNVSAVIYTYLFHVI